MPQIDHALFLDRIFTILSAGETDQRPSETGRSKFFAEDQSVRSFAEVYGEDGRLLRSLAKNMQDEGNATMAKMLSALDEALLDGSLDLADPASSALRLTGFVYPVV